MVAARSKRTRPSGNAHTQDQTLISSAKRHKGNSLLLPLKANKLAVRQDDELTQAVVATELAQGHKGKRKLATARESTPLTACPGAAYSHPESEQDRKAVFAPKFHALPEDHTHLEVHDAPAATPGRRSMTPTRAGRDGDENAEPPLPVRASTVSATTNVAATNTRDSAGTAAQWVSPAMPVLAPDAEECEDEPVFNSFLFIKHLPPLSQCVSGHRQTLLPRQTRSCKQKTLVLDLDETLVHSSLDVCVRADFAFDVTIASTTHTVHVRMRPGLLQFLETVSTLYEVVIFTASQRVYAEQLLNVIDPHKKYIRHRLYRDSCVYVEGNYLKDLTVLGRALEHTIIVDNSPQAFGFQLSNGIPIESWYDDESDRELDHLAQFLAHLAAQEDVRPTIRDTFKLHECVEQA